MALFEHTAFKIRICVQDWFPSIRFPHNHVWWFEPQTGYVRLVRSPTESTYIENVWDCADNAKLAKCNSKFTVHCTLYKSVQSAQAGCTGQFRVHKQAVLVSSECTSRLYWSVQSAQAGCTGQFRVHKQAVLVSSECTSRLYWSVQSAQAGCTGQFRVHKQAVLVSSECTSRLYWSVQSAQAGCTGQFRVHKQAVLVSSASITSVSKVHSATLRDNASILTYIMCCGFPCILGFEVSWFHLYSLLIIRVLRPQPHYVKITVQIVVHISVQDGTKPHCIFWSTMMTFSRN